MHNLTSSLRFILVATVLATCALPHQSVAQLYGLRGGIQQTEILTDVEAGTFGTETGITLGAFLNIPLPANLALAAEGMYSQKIVTQQNLESAMEGEFDPDASLELGYIEIPIMASYRIPLKGKIQPRLYGGPVIGVVVNEKVDLKGKQASDVANEAFILTKEAFKEREIGYTLGGGLTFDLVSSGLLPVYIMLDARYTGGVTTLSEDFAGNPLSRQIKIGAVSLMLGIGF